jgi:hypothetical protein
MNNASVSGFAAVLSIIICCSAAQAAEPAYINGSNPAALLDSVSSQLESQLNANLAPDMKPGDAQQPRGSNDDAVHTEEMRKLSPAQPRVARIER